MKHRKGRALHRRYGRARGAGRYTVEFTGRDRGAIGIFYPMRVVVDAASPFEAESKVLALYERGPATKGAKRGQMYFRIKGGSR
jgi:hypothetical protein